MNIEKKATERGLNAPLTFILLALTLFVLYSCRGEKSRWAGDVTKEGSTRLVHNPAQPLYGELALETELDLSIGNEEESDFRFFRVSDLELDSRDNIYVLDSGNSRVQKFSPDGGYLLTIGKKGQGPGELNSPFSLFIDAADNIYVSERQKMHIFSSAGEFLRSFPLEVSFYDFCVDAEGYIIASGTKSTEEGTIQIVAVCDPEGKMIRILEEFSDVQRVTKSGAGAVVSFKAYHQYSLMLGLASAANDGLIYGYPAAYKIYRSEREGPATLILSKEQKPEEISRAEKDFIIESIGEGFARRGHDLPKDVLEETCQFPPHKPFFRDMRVDDSGRILIMLSGSVLQREAPVSIDVFSPDGIYLYRTQLPFSPNYFRGGSVYDFFTSDETGETVINRYRIKNWDQIRIEAEF